MPNFKTIRTSQGLVEYADAGVGDPLLYFHGFGAAADAILWLESRLFESGFRLIVPNRPGYFGTPLSSGISSTACARLFAALLDELHLSKVAVLGSSGGGFYATRFAEVCPNRTSCLVLECSNTHPWDDPQWLPSGSARMLPLLKSPWLRSWLTTLFRLKLKFMTPGAQLREAAGPRIGDVQDDQKAIEFCTILLNFMRRCLRRSSGFSNDFAVITSEPGFEAGVVRCPTLLIHDERDPIAPIANVHWALARMPRARWFNVRTAGHYVWVGPDAELARHERLQFLQSHLAQAVGPTREEA